MGTRLIRPSGDGRVGWLKDKQPANPWTGCGSSLALQDAGCDGQVEDFQLRLDDQVVADAGLRFSGFACSHGQELDLQIHVQPRRHLQGDVTHDDRWRRRWRRCGSLPGRGCRARGRRCSPEAV